MMSKNRDGKIQGIVFSFDRAMQLDTTLRSFYLHCQDAMTTRLTVLFEASDLYHAGQYATLAKEYPQVAFVPERNFRRDTLKILVSGEFNAVQQALLQVLSYLVNTEHVRSAVLKRLIERAARLVETQSVGKKAARDTAFILFLVNDNIFVRDYSMDEVIQALKSLPDALGFSLRLGRNTCNCYTWNAPQTLPSFTQARPDILSYCWKGADLDFGYPLEVSSSVYRARMIVPLVATRRFHQPNKLKSRLAECSDFLSEHYPNLLCVETSVTFCDPVNRVQENVPNRAGESVASTARDLAERFEHGERIDVKVLDGFVPNGCHQEVAISFERNRRY
jgi:hypothetical protein